MVKKKIRLGDRVKDTVTGFEGVCVGVTKFLNGCVQFHVQEEYKKDGKKPLAFGIDEQTVVLVKPENKKKAKASGGAMSIPVEMRGY